MLTADHASLEGARAFRRRPSVPGRDAPQPAFDRARLPGTGFGSVFSLQPRVKLVAEDRGEFVDQPAEAGILDGQHLALERGPEVGGQFRHCRLRIGPIAGPIVGQAQGIAAAQQNGRHQKATALEVHAHRNDHQVVAVAIVLHRPQGQPSRAHAQRADAPRGRVATLGKDADAATAPEQFEHFPEYRDIALGRIADFVGAVNRNRTQRAEQRGQGRKPEQSAAHQVVDRPRHLGRKHNRIENRTGMVGGQDDRPAGRHLIETGCANLDEIQFVDDPQKADDQRVELHAITLPQAAMAAGRNRTALPAIDTP